MEGIGASAFAGDKHLVLGWTAQPHACLSVVICAAPSGSRDQPCIETRLLDVSDVRDGLPYRSTGLKHSFGVRMPVLPALSLLYFCPSSISLSHSWTSAVDRQLQRRQRTTQNRIRGETTKL